MTQPSGWWMYHGDWGHTGCAAGSNISGEMLSSNGFGILHTLQLGGSVLSVPAVCNGNVYVGLANSRDQVGELGGSIRKIDLASGTVTANYTWEIAADERDAHGFCGMGCTPSVVGGFVYFVGFNAKLYCLNEADLSFVWVTDLRNRDLAQNQPIQSFDPNDQYPPAAGWSAPLVVDGRIFIGIGEGENPHLYSFVYCLDAGSGSVIWIMCTNVFVYLSQHVIVPNPPNMLPPSVTPNPPPAGFTLAPNEARIKGSSVWGCIAYDETLNRLYCPTGNGAPDGALPTQGWTNGLLALDAGTGAFKGFYQEPPESNYRVTDNDVDIGGSPTLFNLPSGQRVVSVASKNGTIFILDADTLELVAQRQMLPYYLDGTQIPTVDPHDPSLDNSGVQDPHVPNETSNDPANVEENFSGSYSTPAYDPATNNIFCGLGGNNYHSISPGIDTATTPFMRALTYNATTGKIDDAWPVDSNDPPRYAKAMPPMYSNFSESGLSSPAVVNDVVFMATTYVSVYAFSTADGTLLWQDQLGEQTGGLNGGYGYCMGPAIAGDYVVAGGLVFGGDGGILRIYGPGGTPPSGN
jgi:outer membrane protein assembly factor BamB